MLETFFFFKEIEAMREANTVENSAFTSGIVCEDQSSIRVGRILGLQQFYYFIHSIVLENISV